MNLTLTELLTLIALLGILLIVISFVSNVPDSPKQLSHCEQTCADSGYEHYDTITSVRRGIQDVCLCRKEDGEVFKIY